MPVDVARNPSAPAAKPARFCCREQRKDPGRSFQDAGRDAAPRTGLICPGCVRYSAGGLDRLEERGGDCLRCPGPNWRFHFSINQPGVDNSVAWSGQATGSRPPCGARRSPGRQPIASARAWPAPRSRSPRRGRECDPGSGVDRCPCARSTDLGIERPRHEATNQMVELRLIPQTSEDNFGSQAGIPGIQRGSVPEQQIGCIAALGDFVEYVESNLPRRRYQIPF